MQRTVFNRPVQALAIRVIGATLLTIAQTGFAAAGGGANFVTYNHHTAEQGEKEVKLHSDFSRAGLDDGYSAQLLELEYGIIDRWTASLYFEGVARDGEPYDFGGWRFENRVRLFEADVPFNPVLYVEYEQLEPSHSYKRAVTGRTDGAEEAEEDEGTEHEVETKLILGQDLSKRLDVGFNWINEANLDTGKWEFGYATGLNYVLFASGEGGEHGGHGSRGLADVEELKLGLELFGGLGDSDDGLTFDWSKTEQYAGINLKAEFEGGFEVGAGVALGLTDDSEDAIVRTMVGYEFH
jgi:hypothetical protein